MIDAAVNTLTGGACAGSAAVLYCAERLPGINRITHRLHTDRIQSLLIMTASAAMTGTVAGRWWNDLINTVNDWLTSWAGHWTGLAIVGVPAMVCSLVYVSDMMTRKVEHRTRLLAAVVPVLATSIPGPIGHFWVAVLTWVVNTVGTLVAGAFGAS